jgi:hypothetical protein
MSTLREEIDVACPFHFLMHHAERYFSVHRRGQTPGTFTLAVDVAKIGLPAKVRAQHDVRIKIAKRKSPEGADTIELNWDPDDRYVPAFAGLLAGERLQEGGSRLVLSGAYQAPLGSWGAVFDSVLGRRIAAATANELLHDIKRFVESDYAMALSTSLASSPKE